MESGQIRRIIRANCVLVLVLLQLMLIFMTKGCALTRQGDDSMAVQVIRVEVDGRAPIAEVDGEGFICATLDWWPPQKCDYGTCSWDHASLLNLDLSNPLLQNAIKAFSPLKIRLGGTLQDEVVYHVGKKGEPCVPFARDQSAMFGFSGGCLPMWRWDELNLFFQSVGCQVAFGLNALYGRTGAKHSGGPWDPTNALDFIRYTHDKGYNISAWEFGNELSGSGIGTSISAEQYAADVKELCRIVKEMYADQPSPPLLVAPDGFFDKEWTTRFLQALGAEDSVNVVSHHIYNLGAGVDSDLMQKILDPSYLDNEAPTFRALKDTLEQYGHGVSPWVGEAGGAYNSGHNLITNAFAMGFWYLDQLGMSATFGTKSYCRQSLVGGNYGLLNTTTFVPNPDYYGALLWHRLMGAKVLAANVSGSPFLRAYAHCSKGNEGATLLLLNLNNQTTYSIDLSTQSSLDNQPPLYVAMRMEYHLTPKDGNLHSQTSLLNGVPLEVTVQGAIPPLLPQLVRSEEPISIKPLSMAFIFLPIQIPACS